MPSGEAIVASRTSGSSHQSHEPFPRAAFRPTSRWTAAAVATAATMTLAGLSASPAQSAPGSACPAPYPVQSLTKGAPVTGLTVGEGTQPDGFTGEVIGVLDNGIMPGLDMILVRLTSTEINRVGGIWSGMSGSPVYAADGRLIGAVSYGLAAGPSKVAGRESPLPRTCRDCSPTRPPRRR